ncbi:hypothetical protein PR002_g9903 [Phytophthora rubi]|uniref:Uncharacterized protein n=1 Tax=Phytophthora rubi TaxID=129364 RepID=A0A6A3MDA1_9STRA|nr:hypothetical protein PR002_g9903 [Phytophthora rubi]
MSDHNSKLLARFQKYLEKEAKEKEAKSDAKDQAQVWWSGSARISRDPDSHSLRPDTD